MSAKKKATAATAKKIDPYIPRTRGVRRPWAATLNTEMGIEGVTLGLTATEVSDTQALLTDYTNKEDAVDAAKAALKNATSARNKAEKKMEADVHPKVKRMKLSGAYSAALGETMGIEGSTHTAIFAHYKPKFRKKDPIFIENNLVHIKPVKGDAESINMYGRLKTAIHWDLIGVKIKYFPFIDTRLLADPKVAEHREYKAHGVYGEHEVGLDSDIISIAYGGGTGGDTTGGVVSGNVPPVTG
ncbi:MAG: hypothetical protein ACYDCN_05015 [Bacteroidia bacterium]